jgi:hypothetical protein
VPRVRGHRSSLLGKIGCAEGGGWRDRHDGAHWSGSLPVTHRSLGRGTRLSSSGVSTPGSYSRLEPGAAGCRRLDPDRELLPATRIRRHLRAHPAGKNEEVALNAPRHRPGSRIVRADRRLLTVCLSGKRSGVRRKASRCTDSLWRGSQTMTSRGPAWRAPVAGG